MPTALHCRAVDSRVLRRNRLELAAIFSALIGGLAFPANSQASVITRTYDFTVMNVHDLTGNNVPAPVTTVAGSVTVDLIQISD